MSTDTRTAAQHGVAELAEVADVLAAVGLDVCSLQWSSSEGVLAHAKTRRDVDRIGNIFAAADAREYPLDKLPRERNYEQRRTGFIAYGPADR